MAAAMAAARGEVADPVAIAAGRITGRSALDVLREAEAAADREDARAEFEARRDKGERLTFIGELEDPSTRSRPPTTAARRALEKRNEVFRAAVAARREAERRRGDLEDAVPSVRAPHRASGRRRSR